MLSSKSMTRDHLKMFDNRAERQSRHVRERAHEYERAEQQHDE
jgi:hypothetical protein